MAQDPFAQYAVNPAPATPENDPFAQYAGAEAGTDPFAQYDVMRQRPAIQPNPLDTVVPTALRVGGAVVGGALGALAGLPGVVAGGAAGSGLGELAAEAYEKSRGLRDETNWKQVATQTALGAIPIAGKVGSVAATAARRAGQGFVLGAGGDTMTRLAEGEDPSLAGMLVSGGLGAVMGGGTGAVEARRALRAADQARRGQLAANARALRAAADATAEAGQVTHLPPTVREMRLTWDNRPDATPTALPEGTRLEARAVLPESTIAQRTPDPRLAMTPPDRLTALREAQNAPRLRQPGETNLIEDAQEHFVNERAALDRFMREGGLDPLAMDASVNPSKLADLAIGGDAGKIERAAIELRAIQQEAQEEGLSDALHDLLNLGGMESGADKLSRRVGRETAERIMEEAPRRIGREPRQIPLIEKSDEPLDAIGRQVAEEEAKRAAELAAQRAANPPAPPLTVNRATATAIGHAPMRTIRVAPGTGRTDKFDVVPLETPPPQKRGPRQEPLTPEQLAEPERQRIAQMQMQTSDEVAEEVQPTLFSTLDEEIGDVIPEAVPRQTEWEIPTQSDLERAARGRRPVAQVLQGMPTKSEIDAINARIDRAKLAEVDTRTTDRLPVNRWNEDKVQEVAQELGVSPDHVRAFARAAEDKGGLPDWLIRREILDAKRRGSWAIEAGERGELHEALQAGRALPLEITPGDLAAARNRWQTRTDLTPEQKQKAEQLAARIFDINRRALDTVTQAGLVKPEVADELRRLADEAAKTGRGGYVPLTRVFDDLDTAISRQSGVQVGTQHYLHRLNGSELLTEHPIEATLNKVAVAVQEAGRNRAMQSFVALRNQNDFFKRHIIPMNPPKGSNTQAPKKLPPGFAEITVFEEGVPRRYAVPEPVATALKAPDPETANIIVQVLQKGAGVFRAGTTTANLAFALPNVVRDVSDMAVLTGRNPVLGALNPAVLRDWARAWLDVARQSPDYLTFLDSGAAFSTFQKNVDEVHQFLRIGSQANPSKFASAGRVFTRPLDAARWFNNTLEEATKLAAFREFQRQGLSPDEVAWRTRRFGGSPDYARRGRSMKTANMLMPFLNAQVQGVARLVPYLRKNPQHAAYVAAATLGHMALLQQYNNLFTDPDGTQSWKRISPREKEQNWVFFIPGTFTDPETGIERQNYIKIPVGHAVNLLRAPFQAVLDPDLRSAENILNTAVGALPTSPRIDFDRPLATFAQSLGAALNPVLRVPAELRANRDFFRDMPIVPRRLENVAPEQQATDMTSPTARKLGEVTGWSPMAIEHAVRGFGGGVGEMALSALDSLQDAPSRKPVTEVPGLRELTEAPVVGGVARPVVRRFLGGPSSIDAINNDRKDRFYRLLNEANQVRATYNLMRREGNREAMRAIASDERRRRLYRLQPTFARLSRQIAELRRAKNFQGEARLLEQMERLLAEAEGR